MNKKHGLSVLIMGLALTASLAACGYTGGTANSGAGRSSNGGQNDELWICVYDGGYGTQWLKDVGADFTAATGIKVHYDADTSLLDRIESALRDGGDYDLYMSHGLNWQTYAANGWLASLDDVYSSPVEGFSGTFADRVINGASEFSKTVGKDNAEHYYKVCYTQGAGGFVYNMNMFKKNSWSIPKTYADLVTLCNTINAAGLKNSLNKPVRPFAWSGSDREYYWDYPLFEWWAQLAGIDKVETVHKYLGPTGLYSDGYEMYNPNTYYKEFMQAYDMWYGLIGNNSGNYCTNDYSATLSTAKAEFITGQAAMMPYAQWAKYELEELNDGPLDFNIAMMPTPKATASSIDVNYRVGFGDSMIVPSNAVNVSAAKKFINFMATKQACKTFVKDSRGAFLAFNYSDIDMSDIEKDDPYIKSVHAKVNFTGISDASTNPITYRNINCVMPWVLNKYYYKSCCSDPSNYTASKVGASVYASAKENWATWLRNASLSD
ncbi:MAG: extracellular solute-binding protein [Bacilli bacterium]|jgi:N-acetylglucosamine transport system substrate-binding protein|nr:extracellular solute-binding protein [Bacilli bacterium]